MWSHSLERRSGSDAHAPGVSYLALTADLWGLNPLPAQPASVLTCLKNGARELRLHSPLPSFQVDVYVMTQPLSGKWIHFGTEVTNSSGRLTFPVPSERALGIGVYPVRMVVR